MCISLVYTVQLYHNAWCKIHYCICIISCRHNATARPVHWRILQDGAGYYSSEMPVEKSTEKSA